MSNPRLLQIFNRYLEPGGEEASAERVFETAGAVMPVTKCWFASEEWKGENAPAPWKQALLMFSNPDAMRRILTAQRECGAEAWLIHNVFPVGSAAIYREAMRLRVPVIQYCHNFRPFSVNGYCWDGEKVADQGLNLNFWPEIRAGAWQDSKLKTAWFACVLRRLHASGWLKSVKAWIAISDFLREKFIEAGIPAERIHTLRHSWDLVNIRPVQTNGEHFLFLGRLIKAKGVLTLLDSWRMLREQLRGECPKLVIAGDGPLADVVRSASAASGGTIECAGYVSGETKHALLQAAKAVIGPSIWWEALGLTAYEAYDYGKPVLASASGGLLEIVRNGETGLLHEPGNALQLMEQVRRILESPSLGAEMGSSGRAWLEANTRPEDWIQGFQNIIVRALR